MHYYSLEGTINQFFSGRTITQEECDRQASEFTGETVKPVPIQGAFSYTVAGGNMVVQFRTSESLLNTKILALARKIYGNVVPACIDKGIIGQPPSSLNFYVMDKIPGITYIEVRSATMRCASWQEQTISDFARFFANSWLNRLEEPYHSDDCLVHLQDKLDILLRELPSRFINVITKAREELPKLFIPTYPLVLTHGDLCEMNILVNPEAGGITGIIDWAEAKVLPFGMSLWGVQSMLGFMDSSGWHYHENASRLEALFWDVFHRNVGTISSDDRHAIKIAERAGLLLRYGFIWEDGVIERPINEQDSSIRYLDAFLFRSPSPEIPSSIVIGRDLQ